MGEGFLPLQRSFFTHPLWMEQRDYSRAEAFLDLMQSAAYTNRQVFVNGKMIEVAKGEFVAAVRFLENRWQWSNTKVSMFLEMLRRDGTITTTKRQGITIILINGCERVSASSVSGKRDEKRRENDGEAPSEHQKNDKEEKCKKAKTEQAALLVANAAFNASELPPSLDEVISHALGTAQIPDLVARAYWLDRSKTNPPFTFANGQGVGDWRIDLLRYWQHWQEKKKTTKKPTSNGKSKHEQPDHRIIKLDGEHVEPPYRTPVIALDE